VDASSFICLCNEFSHLEVFLVAKQGNGHGLDLCSGFGLTHILELAMYYEIGMGFVRGSHNPQPFMVDSFIWAISVYIV